ncbi:YitT family protein [Aurantimonas sp. A2-1-M11]|uniref:YitT family protein n=1 Tax=Aurantimonas sp. A2-1-M11 TaxID=3113712 RepID=UPI002F93A52F
MASDLGRWAATATHHSPLEDAQGIVTGALMVTIGLSILAHLGFVTGGTAGLALIVSYATGWNVGVVFFVVNLPFYGLAIRRLGWAFTIKTFLAVACLSVLTALQPHYFTLGAVYPLVGAVLGGMLIGFGLLALFRHRASLGGVGILAIYLQDRMGWKAGLTQLAIDLTILALSFAVADPVAIAYSIIGAVVLNLSLSVNHRPDRYIAA